MSSRALIVDATHLLDKALETVAPDRARAADGSQSHALSAVARALSTVVGFKTPDVAVAVLTSTDSDDPQHKRLPELLEAHGVSCVQAPGRAADCVASYVEAALGSGRDVVIVGSDKRFAQLVSEKCGWYDVFKRVRYTPELVKKRFEVAPDVVAGWLALVGDDGVLAGVKGLGKKGASAIIEAHGSVMAALADPDAVQGRPAKAFVRGQDDARAQLSMATLDRGEALPAPLEELSFSPDDEARDALHRALGFVGLIEAEEASELDVAICRSDAELAAALDTLEPDRRVALHVITGEPSAVRGALVGLAMVQGERAMYASFVGAQAPSPDAAPLARWLGDPSRPKVGHHVGVAKVALLRHGVSLEGIDACTACASHLREPSNFAPHDLTDLSRLVLGRALPGDESVRGKGRRQKPWGRVKPEVLGRFAAGRAQAAQDVWEALGPAIDSDADQALLEEYLAFGDTLVRMELRGIAVAAEDLARVGADFDALGARLEQSIYRHAGEAFNIGSTKQLGAVLFEQLGLPIMARTKTGWSTATSALERIAGRHPIVPLVIRWRRLRRLTDTWVTALGTHIGSDGRVHASMHPARSFTGRVVCSSPDLGRVPGRTEEMVRIRKAFVAPPGTRIVSLDYAQLGLYVLAHLSGDPALVEPLQDGADMHTLTAAAVLEIEPRAVDYDKRQTGKVVNFATFAGQGASALAQQLGIEAAEAKTMIERFDRRYAGVRAFQEEQLRLAKEEGHITTIAGRRWPIGQLESPNAMERGYAERLARRATHEASVADVSRRGLLAADRALRERGLVAAPLLQMHDEVLFEVPEAELDEAIEVASVAMREAYELSVPLRVEANVGRSWGELEEWPS